MKILAQDERCSERLIRKLTADILNIPESDDGETQKTATDEAAKCAKCGSEMADEKCVKCAKEASDTTASACPKCDSPMQVIANIERCVCGYGQPARKKAEDTSVGEYYRKIFPDAYVSEMTGDPKETGDEEVKYEMKSNTKVSAREVMRRKRVRRKMHGSETAGECEVPDAHPESGVNEGSGATATPDPNEQKDESANSVTGPEKANSHGTGLQDPGSVSAPDLGLPKGAKKEQWITREVMATLCPPCAEEMRRRGITKVKASTVAKLIAARADEAGWKVKGAAPGKKDPKGVRRAPKAPKGKQ